MNTINPILAIDASKFGHMDMHPANIAKIYTNMTPRPTKYFERAFPAREFNDGKLITFDMQMTIQVKLLQQTIRRPI